MTESDLNVLRSSLDLLILKSLTGGARHGYGVAEWLQQLSDDILLLEEGTLYPALHRLEGKGWVTSEWGVSENNRRARFYRLSPSGRAQLRRGYTEWLQYVEAIGRVLGGPPAEPSGVTRR